MKIRMAAMAALLPLIALTACGGEADAQGSSSTEVTDSPAAAASVEESETVEEETVENAEAIYLDFDVPEAFQVSGDPVETVRKILPLVQAEDWEGACYMMSDLLGTPNITYDYSLEPCAAVPGGRAQTAFFYVTPKLIDAILAAPVDQVAEAPGDGHQGTDLTFYEADGGPIAVAAMFEYEGLWFVGHVLTACPGEWCNR